MLLNHVNIRCNDVDAMAEFLEHLGCVYRGERPSMKSHGHWLYDDSGKAVIHLSQTESTNQKGSIDHIAFELDDIATFRELLQEAQLEYTEKYNEAACVRQIKINAPEHVILEFQFPGN